MTTSDAIKLKTWDWTLNNCQLARLHGMDHTTVRRVRARIGLPPSPRGTFTHEFFNGWDWSLSDCKLAKLHGVNRRLICTWRKKLGFQPFKRSKREAQLGRDRTGSINAPIPISQEDFPQEFLDKFWARVTMLGSNECWPWVGAVDKRSGYGLLPGVKPNGRKLNYFTHRLAYAFNKGPVPPGLIVLHSCDNPICCNPAHLSVGNDLQNSREAFERGRIRLGAERRQSILNDRLVRHIRALRDGGSTTLQIGRKLGLNTATVYGVVSGKSWRHVI